MAVQFVATQLFVGESERRAASPRDMTAAIRAARELAGIDALIVWPCSDRSLLGALVEAARSCGMRTHLWFPVLADPPGGAVPPDAEIVHF
ncbi:MAG TPA: hypothetical protein VHE79_03610, partial [Spirochaetia bacterium]